MARDPRLDAASTLHWVITRGIDRQSIFRDDQQREDFVGRLAGLAEAGALAVYAWAPIPNHVHLLVPRGARPLIGSMRFLLTPPCGAPLVVCWRR